MGTDTTVSTPWQGLSLNSVMQRWTPVVLATSQSKVLRHRGGAEALLQFTSLLNNQEYINNYSTQGIPLLSSHLKRLIRLHLRLGLLNESKHSRWVHLLSVVVIVKLSRVSAVHSDEN